VDNLDDYIGAIIDIDGTRYRLAGLDGSDALLADLLRYGGTIPADRLVRMPVAEVAEAMVHIVVATGAARSTTSVPGAIPHPRSQPCHPSSPPQPSR